MDLPTGKTGSRIVLTGNLLQSILMLHNRHKMARQLWFGAKVLGYNNAGTAVVAQAVFDNSNTKFSSSGGTINGNVIVTGNLNVGGTFTTVNTQSLQSFIKRTYIKCNVPN
jgi:hypothetical protein